jgi:DNA-directed RNA polymerase alpha subunit
VISLLSRPTGKLHLSTRARRRLEKTRIDYIWQLIEKTEQELLQIGGLGQGTLQDIKMVLIRHGLRLATVIPPQVRATLPGASST